MTNNKNKGINLIEYNYSNLITGLLFEETYKLVLKLEEYLKTYSLSLDPLHYLENHQSCRACLSVRLGAFFIWPLKMPSSGFSAPVFGVE